MTSILIFCIVLLIIYCLISWVIPKLLAWYFERKYKIVLRVGRIGIPYLRLCDVNLTKNGYTIHIEETSIRSSFFNSEVTKLITIVAKDVRVNKDIGQNNQSDSFDRQLLSMQKSNVDFRNKKIPHSISTLAQFMAIRVYNISVMLLRPETPGLLVHATAEELHIDGSVVQNARSLLVNVTLADAKAKVLRHAEAKEGGQTCLGELCFGISLEATLAAQGPLAVEKLHVIMTHTTAIISDGLYGFAQENNVSYENKQFRSRNKPNIYLQIAPIIPKNFVLKIDDTNVRSVRDNSRTDFNAMLKNLTINSRFNCSKMNAENPLPEIRFAYKMTELIVKSNREKLIYLHTFSLDASLEFNIIAINIQMRILQVIYNHVTIQKWIHSNFLQNRTARSKDSCKRDASGASNGWLPKLLSTCILQGDAEVSDVAALIKLDDDDVDEQNGSNVSCLGVDNVRFNLKQSTESRGITYESYVPRLLLADRHWQTDLEVQSLWWSLSKDEPNTSRLRKVHPWGTPLYLEVGIVKLGSHGSVETKIESLFENVHLEWSPLLAQFMLTAVKCLEQYEIDIYKRNASTAVSKAKKEKNKIIVVCNSKNINCFFLAEHNTCIISRLNQLKVENQKNIQKMSVTTQGLKVSSLVSDKPSYKCLSAESMDNYCAYIKKADFEHETRIPLTYSKILLKEEVSVHWSTNLHLRFLTLAEEILRFSKEIRSDRVENEAVPTETRMNNVSLRLTGNIFLDIKISSAHCAKISVDDMTISYIDKNLGILNNSAVIAIDNADIFTIQGLNWHRIQDSAVIRQERLDNEGFHAQWNKTWGFTVSLFKASFPYEHQFAEAFQNQFVSVFKWLKIVHKKKKVPFTVNSPLPSDMFINIKEFVFEMSDDPFEVKLRDNYILLEDEFKENLKRKKMLNEKVQEMCKTRLHLPQAKVEELYANLNKKNAEIYVQRSRQMQETAPARTRLFAWQMTDVEIMVLADVSLHGTDNCAQIMRDIDPESLWPEDGLEFSTLWCRVVSFRCKEWKFQLRDFPQPLLDIRQMYMGGQLVGAEQVAPRRARRDVIVELGEPWGSAVIERGMTSLKFYHDFNCEIDFYSYAFGPCWEPVIEQCNLSFEKISAPSRDPSPRLCFWDKMRLLWHGRLTMVVQQLTVLLHASLDPYNTTEEMELTWNQLVMDWTNAKFVYKGDLNIFVRTASKYDDCQLLHIPNLKLTVKLHWLCLANPNDHHCVIQCAPDKIPEYSINQEHDSFRAFRSQNVNISIALETKPPSNQSPTNIDGPMLMLYGSTLRWFENLKLILSGVTRPTRRGRIFSNVRPRKMQLSRHYKKVHLSMGLHRFQMCYWMSFAMQRGCELNGGRLSSSSEHSLSIVPVDDGLKHRPKTEWSIIYMNSDLNNSEIWLKSALQEDPEKEPMSLRQPVEKCYCLSVAKVSYGRETILTARSEHSGADKGLQGSRDTPTHRLVVYDLRGAWTNSNRNVAFALFDTFMKNKQMKKNLSTEALKGFRKENSTPLKRRNNETPGSSTPPNPPPSALPREVAAAQQDTPSPLSKLQSGHAATMLQQLIAEAENKAVVFSDDLSSATRQQHLQGLQACQEDDVQHKNWLIALVNAQVLLKGCETKGYVILSAAKAEILQRVHRPVWKDRTLVSKTTWVGSLESLQYFATVSEGETDSLDDNIMWLKVENIQENNSTVISDIPDVPDLVGSGQSVGGVVSETVGGSSQGENCSMQLQRIVSRCKCEFFYAGYGDISVDPEVVGEVPPAPQEEVVSWDRRQTAVDAFTLMHYDLDVCTNSLQYAMLLDIVNNLLLYVEPRRKEALERLARMRFQLQLHSVEDQRRPIQNLQNQVRSNLSKLRRLEKESYFMYRALAEDPNNVKLIKEMEEIEHLVYQCKEQLNSQTEELDMMLSCYKESRLSANSRLATTRNDKPLTVVRANEICFKHAQWRLTEADGQLGIADLVLSNFLYTKNSKSDDSVEHLLELGYVRMTNLIPNQIYKEILCPTEIQSHMPVEHKRVVRVFCREKPPVGGISVKEHFEINVVPLTIGLTKKFYNKMLRFCFPERDPDNIEGEAGDEIDVDSRGKKTRSSGKKSKETNFYVKIDHKDDIEKMKERAEKNKLFIYIKIPEVPVRVSYKGNKEKNIEDIRDFSLVIPTLEYHNVTWTWLDLLLAIKSDSRRVILPQAIKQKLQINRNRGLTDESSSPQEEDKARILFGSRHAAENRSLKKGVSGVFKFSK